MVTMTKTSCGWGQQGGRGTSVEWSARARDVGERRACGAWWGTRRGDHSLGHRIRGGERKRGKGRQGDRETKKQETERKKQGKRERKTEKETEVERKRGIKKH